MKTSIKLGDGRAVHLEALAGCVVLQINDGRGQLQTAALRVAEAAQFCEAFAALREAAVMQAIELDQLVAAIESRGMRPQ